MSETTIANWTQQAAASKREQVRVDVLKIGSDIAARPAPDQVLAIARTVMAWIDDADDDTDRSRRINAAKRAHRNYLLDMDRWNGVVNRAARFVDEAIELHGFLAA